MSLYPPGVREIPGEYDCCGECDVRDECGCWEFGLTCICRNEMGYIDEDPTPDLAYELRAGK